jgi:hypothetical protein
MWEMKSLSKAINQVKEWCKDQPVRLCVLFGSQATGRANIHSAFVILPKRFVVAPEILTRKLAYPLFSITVLNQH